MNRTHATTRPIDFNPILPLMDTSFGEDEESEVINKRFLEALKTQGRIQDNSQNPDLYVLNDQQLEEFKRRFRDMAQGQQMNYECFRRSLGLLGRENSFIGRIFRLIDTDGNGIITESDFVAYLSVILMGTSDQKARFGWRILSRQKPELTLEDFQEIFEEVSVVWNSLTGQIIIPLKKYVESLFNILDVDQDNFISFQEQV